MSDLPFQITDYLRFDRFRDARYVGRAFAFLDAAGAGRLKPPETDAQVISLLGDVPIELPGISVGPRSWSNLQLHSIRAVKRLLRGLGNGP